MLYEVITAALEPQPEPATPEQLAKGFQRAPTKRVAAFEKTLLLTALRDAGSYNFV